MKISIAFFLLLFSVTSFAIYEQDSRKNLFEVQSIGVQKVASAMAIQVDKHDLRGWTFNRFWKLVMKPLHARGVCRDEKFSEEVSMRKTCSAILVAPKILLTAGNCITEHYCRNDLYYWMFNYDLKEDIPFDYKHHRKNFYQCKRIIKRVFRPDSATSFTLLELADEVKGIEPVKIARSGEVNPADELITLGHVQGLPLKIADNAKAYDQNKSHFILNSDISGSTLGSAVINARTYELEGILIFGSENYTYADDECKTAPIYLNHKARELAIKSSVFLEEINQ